MSSLGLQPDWVLRHQCYSPFPSDFRDILWDGCAIIKKIHTKKFTQNVIKYINNKHKKNTASKDLKVKDI